MAIDNWTCFSCVAYAPGTIAVIVTLTEREFNACQTHRSMYTSIFNRLHAIARYWSEIATYSYPLAFNAPVRSGPWDNRGKCYMDRKRIQCWSKASQQVPIIFNRFPVIQAVKSKVRNFSTFLHILASRPWDLRGNVTWIEREFNACQTLCSMYPSIFNHFWDIASYWSKIATFSHPTFV